MISIKLFSNKYLDGVVDVILPIQQSEFGIPITLEDQPDLMEIPGFYQVNNGNFWIALHNGSVVGTIALIDIGDNGVALRKMFVKKRYRGAGYNVANKLLQIVLDWSEEKSVRTIYLGTTPKFLAAHRFYEKNNFIEIAKKDLPGSFPVMSVDTKFYKLQTSSREIR